MVRKIIDNFILYLVAFFISLYLHRKNLLLSGDYGIYFSAFMFSWGIASLISRKFKSQKEYNYYTNYIHILCRFS